MATKTRELADFILEEGIGGDADIAIQGEPHIQPGVLHPSYVASGTSNKLLDGSTDHSGAFGTAQSDGRSYYYTNIAGSKPIKDPRIGAHFGSQRHMFKSIQLLEQETKVNAISVWSIDGREWMRAVNIKSTTANRANGYVNDTSNVQIRLNDATTAYFEITGYFNAFYYIGISSDTTRPLKVEIDGVTAHTAFNPNGSVNSPLTARYVSAGSVFNVDLTSSSSLSSDTALGIHTIRISYASGSGNYPTGCELIAQDTTSTATKSKIQIPAQNVVSYGKKFSLSAAGHHYNPFAFKTDGTTAWTAGNHNGTAWPVGTGSSANIDTATSLGLSAWISTNYYYPYNGGRVVWWIDSSGTLKCSVNMMPPNAQNILGSSINAKANASVANNTFLPTFSGAVDNSQAELAKLFHIREFGNGSANQGPAGSLADASMVSAADNISYVMDDGLTGMAAKNWSAVYNDGTLRYSNSADGEIMWITFIGTGITHTVREETRRGPIAQNLPYGTHIFKFGRMSGASKEMWIDGVEILDDNYGDFHTFVTEESIFQPKRPPIPEEAVVIADYMLMADHVNKTSYTAATNIDKGVRLLDCSRDMFHNTTSGTMLLNNLNNEDGYPFRNYMNSGSGGKLSKVPAFGTSFGINALAAVRGKPQVAGSDVAHTDVGTHVHINSAVTLGNNLFGWQAESGQDGGFFRFEIATPIHTSSHYQTFETEFLHELVGGDRNMEQNNLVVTADGKTWDEVTRDTSYIGNIKVSACTSYNVGSYGGIGSSAEFLKWDEGRGFAPSAGLKTSYNKDFAISYDRVICLVDGMYTIMVKGQTWDDGSAEGGYIRIYTNGANTSEGKVNSRSGTSDANTVTNIITVPLKRGDYVQASGRYFNTDSTLKVNFEITKV